MAESQINFLQALGWAVLNSLWQMALLWVVYSLLCGVFRPRPAQKASLATGLLISGFAWFVFTFLSILTIVSPHSSIITTGMLDASSNAKLNAWLETMLPLASMLYLVLLILPVYNFIRNYRYVQVIRNQAITKVGVDWKLFVRNVSERMGITRNVKIWISELVTSPVTIGYLKPVILVPLAAINHLSSQQMEAVLLHELAHIRRHDYLLNLIIRFIQSILYFNPFVNAMVKSIEREREKSCDDIVLQFQYDPHVYASALLTIEKSNHFPRPFAVASSGRRNDLLHRVEWLLGIRKTSLISFNRLAGIMAGLLCFIGLNALLIASRPERPLPSMATLPHMYSPFYFFTNGERANHVVKHEEAQDSLELADADPAVAEQIANKSITVELPVPPQLPPLPPVDVAGIPANPAAYQFVNYLQNVLPELNKQQEQQMKEALANSRKVIEEMQWKAMEKEIADAMLLEEKELVKSIYEKEMQEEMAKVNWESLENNIRIAYDNIDWNTINERLNVAMTQIKLDSLHTAYNQALAELSKLQSSLNNYNITAIPDTDITIEKVEERKIEVSEALKKVKAIRERKIVNL